MYPHTRPEESEEEFTEFRAAAAHRRERAGGDDEDDAPDGARGAGRPAKRRRFAPCPGDDDPVEPPSPLDQVSVSDDDEADDKDASKSDSEGAVKVTPQSEVVARFMRRNEYLELALLCVSAESPDFCAVVRFVCEAFVEAVTRVPAGTASAGTAFGPSLESSLPADEARSPSPHVVETPEQRFSAVRHVSFAGACNVVGDLHGDWDSLLYILKSIGGVPSESLHILFNGDLIDRGPCSLRVALLVMALKAQYPEFVHVNRGNHEFMDEGLHSPHVGNLRADLGEHEELEDVIMEALACLPLAHVLHGASGSKRVIAVAHAGLPMEEGGRLATLDDLARSAQPRPLYHGSLNSLEYSVLWNDPCDENGIRPSPRGGAAILFGPDKTAEFLEANGLSLFIRSHQMVDSGYQLTHNGGLVTVMSTIDPEHSPSASFIRIDAKDMKHHCETFSVADIEKLQKVSEFF